MDGPLTDENSDTRVPELTLPITTWGEQQVSFNPLIIKPLIKYSAVTY